MPYSRNGDLPSDVKRVLPHDAQTIFRKAFNSALDEYEDEETAFKVAWSAVKKKYSKSEEGHWVEK